MSNNESPEKAVASTADEIKKEAARKWREANKLHLRGYHRKYYSDHKEKIKNAIKEAKEKKDSQEGLVKKKRGRPRIPISPEFCGQGEIITN
jgi:hypothetical protein